MLWWRDAGVFETINHMLVMAERERVGREVSLSAVVLDSHSVKTTESGGPPFPAEGRRRLTRDNPYAYQL